MGEEGDGGGDEGECKLFIFGIFQWRWQLRSPKGPQIPLYASLQRNASVKPPLQGGARWLAGYG